MEAPTPIDYQYNKSSNLLLLNFDIKFKNDIIIFHLYETNNSKIKLIANKQDLQKPKLISSKYEVEINLDELKKQNKYFKMFDTYQEFKINFIDLCKADKINIVNLNENEIIISINLMVISDNLMNLTLKKNKNKSRRAN